MNKIVLGIRQGLLTSLFPQQKIGGRPLLKSVYASAVDLEIARKSKKIVLATGALLPFIRVDRSVALRHRSVLRMMDPYTMFRRIL